MERIRSERLRLRSFPNVEEEYNGKNLNNGSIADVDKKIINDEDEDNVEHEYKSIEELQKVNDIDNLLSELKKNEPSSDNQFFRLSVIAYEIGDLHRAVAYANRFKDDEKMRLAHLANGKLALADALTQLYLLCLSLEWDFNNLRELGVFHLQERHEDFKRDGWSEIK